MKIKNLTIIMCFVINILFSSCINVNNSHNVNSKLYNNDCKFGLFFCKPGYYEIFGYVDHFKAISPDTWKGELRKLNVIEEESNSLPYAIEGFTIETDANVNRFFISNVCQNVYKQKYPLYIQLSSKKKPGKISISIKKKITNTPQFVEFDKSHFLLNGKNPFNLNYSINNSEYILTFLLNNVPKPPIKQLQNNKIQKNLKQLKPNPNPNPNIPVVNPPINKQVNNNINQKKLTNIISQPVVNNINIINNKTNNNQQIQNVSGIGIFTPFSVSISETFKNKIDNIFQQKDIESVFKDNVQNKNLDIKFINYPKDINPLTDDIINGPIISFDSRLVDRTSDLIKNLFNQNSKLEGLCFVHLKEDLLFKSFKIIVNTYSSINSQPETISIAVNTADKDLKNTIITKVDNIVDVLSRQFNLITNIPSKGIDLINIYQTILSKQLYCNPDLNNKSNVDALEKIAKIQNSTYKNILSQINKRLLITNFQKESLVLDYGYFKIKKGWGLKTSSTTDITMPDFSLKFFYSQDKADNYNDANQFAQGFSETNQKWRVPDIEELIYIFQPANNAQVFEANKLYHFWSSTLGKPDGNKKKFWLIKVSIDNQNSITLDFECLAKDNNASILIVSN